MSGAPSLRRNTLWTTLGQLSTVVLQALYFVLIGRTLGSYDYGMFVGVYSLVAVLSPYSTLGFGMIMLRDASRSPARLAESWSKALLVLGAGSALITLITIAISHFIFRHDLFFVVLCVTISEAFCSRVVELAGQAFQAHHKLAWTARLNTLMGVARALAASALAVCSQLFKQPANLRLWTLIYTVFSIATAFVALSIVHFKLVRPKWCRISRAECYEGLSFALSNSSYSIYNDIDKTMLASYGFVQAAGTYAAAYRVIEVATAPIRAVYSAAMPRIFEYGSQSLDKVTKFILFLLKWTVLYAAIAFIGMVWLAPAFPVVIGKSYIASVSAIRMLALIPVLRCFHYAAGNAISGSASQWYRTTSQIFAAFLNFSLNLFLIPHWSWQGAALASLITDGSLGAINWITFLYIRNVSICRLSRASHQT